MAVGDDAASAGFAVVPISGPTGKVHDGYLEINRTRDYVAQVKNLIPSTQPVNKGGTGATDIASARVNLGFSYGTDAASDTVGGAVDGNVYFKIVS